MDNMSPKKKIEIPKKNWTWSRKSFKGGYRYYGVHTYEGCLLWYTETYPAYAGGGAHSQSFAEYILNGPSVDEVPQEILDEIDQMLESYTELILEKDRNKS